VVGGVIGVRGRTREAGKRSAGHDHLFEHGVKAIKQRHRFLSMTTPSLLFTPLEKEFCSWPKQISISIYELTWILGFTVLVLARG